MKKEHPLPAQTIDFSESLAEHPFVQWFSQNGRTLLWAFLGAIFIFLIYYRFTGGEKATESEYIQAENDFRALSKETSPEPAKEEVYKRLASLLEKHPELQAKYDGPLAQILLNHHDLPLAKEPANRTFARIESNHLEFQENYARTSFLIGEKNYAEALSQALQLKEQLLAEKNPADFGKMLYLFNLLRIAIMNQLLGHQAEEYLAWQAFKESPLQKAGVDPQTFNKMITQLGDGKDSLLNYIEARERVLKQKQ